MRKVLEEICEHEIYITRRKINRRDFVISLISISGSILFIISLIFFFLFLPDHWITSLFMGLSVFVVLFFLISILGLKEVIEENEVLGILKDYEISFKVIEKKELIEYTFEIGKVRDIKVINNKTLVIFITNGTSYTLVNIHKAVNIVKVFKLIKQNA